MKVGHPIPAYPMGALGGAMDKGNPKKVCSKETLFHDKCVLISLWVYER